MHIVLLLTCSSVIDSGGTIYVHENRLGYLFLFRILNTKIANIVCIIKEEGFYIYIHFDENPKISPSVED